jgi:putative intracellular protease/amidase
MLSQHEKWIRQKLRNTGTYGVASGLQSVAGDIWARGGVVAAVCHGPVLLPGVIDPKTGKSIIEGKTLTGFPIEGEMIFRLLEKLKSDKVLTVVEAVSRVGADHSSPMRSFLTTTRLLRAG